MVSKKKLKSYIRDDRPNKLKRYVLSHDGDINSVTLSDGGGMLHYCARAGSPQVLKCLLQLECDPSRQDRDGNLPLHIAAQRALDGFEGDLEEVCTGLVQPLLNAYPMGQDVENKQWVTGQDLVSQVKKKLKKEKSSRQKSCRVEDSDEEEKWRNKLAEEAMFEFEEHNEHTYSDFEQDYGTSESFDNWSERMRREYTRKQQRIQHQSFPRDRKRKGRDEEGETKSKRKKEREKEEDNLKKAREEMRKRYKPPNVERGVDTLIVKKKRYEEKFSHLINHLAGKTLTFANIPWPHSDVDRVLDTLFCDFPDRKSVVFRKYLRSQQVRWHPDKFTQKFGEHLHPDHKGKILNRVKVISQMLNKIRMDQER